MAKKKFVVTARVQNDKGEWLQPGDEVSVEVDKDGQPVSRLYRGRVGTVGRTAETSDSADAQKVVKDAEDKAKQIIKEAEEKADEILKEAQANADKLIADALNDKKGK